MMSSSEVQAFLAKALESLAGAETEYAERRYNNCANRSYYACYQAAVAALVLGGIRPNGPFWSHDWVQSTFAGLLINRRKLYPSDLSDDLGRLMSLRQRADYETLQITPTQATRALRRAREFVRAIEQGGRPT